MELLKSLLKPLFKYYRQRTRKSLLPTFSTSMVGGPMQHLHKAKHGKKGWAEGPKVNSHTPSGLDHANLECD
jgi:hypothetical protein